MALRPSIAGLAVLVAACAHLPGSAHTLPAPLPSPGLRLDVFIPRAGPIQARLRVPKERLPQTPETSPIEFVHPEDAARTKGLPTTVTVSSAKDLELTWEVQPTPLDALTDPAVRRTAAPFDTGGARYLPLVALVPFASQLRISALVPVSLHVRSDLPIACTLDGTAGSYWATDLDTFVDAFLVAGPRSEALGSKGLRFMSAEVSEPELQKLAALERESSALLEKSVGPRRPLRAVVVAKLPRKAPRDGLRGTNFGSTAVVLVESGFDGAALSPDALVALHELVHSSLPPDGKLPPWIFEGLTEYFALRLALSIDGFPEETLRELVVSAWRAFVDQSPDRKVGGTSITNYSGGLVLAHCVEVRLRRDGSSLAQVLKQARANVRSGRLTNDQWEREMAVTSSSAGARIVSARFDPLDPPERCFEEEGAVPRAPVEGVSLGWIEAMTGISAINVAPGSFGVAVIGASGRPFQAGDRLTWVDGTRVVSAQHFQELLFAASVKGTTRIEYLRDTVSRYVDLPLRAPRSFERVVVRRPVWTVPRP